METIDYKCKHCNGTGKISVCRICSGSGNVVLYEPNSIIIKQCPNGCYRKVIYCDSTKDVVKRKDIEELEKIDA